jgi:hypothetical protein
MYFSSKHELQGEYQEEVQTLDYDVHIFEEGELSKPSNQDAGELDLSDINLDQRTPKTGDEHDQSGDEHPKTKIVASPSFESLAPQATDTPNQSLVENVPDLVSEPFRIQLPPRRTRGIPKPTYEPELSSKVKYAMSHYMSNHRLSGSNQSFVNQLSTVSIPNSMQEALADLRWRAAMNEEMKTLQKKKPWELVDRPPGKKPVGC